MIFLNFKFPSYSQLLTCMIKSETACGCLPVTYKLKSIKAPSSPSSPFSSFSPSSSSSSSISPSSSSSSDF